MRKQAIFILFVLGLIISETGSAQVIDSLGYEEKPKGMEIIARRTWNSKTYLNDDTVTVEISGGYVHYRDRDGSFQEIDRAIVLAPDSSHYQVTRGLYHAAFGFDLTRDEYPITFELKDGTQLHAKLTGLAYYNRASKQLVTLHEVQKTKGTPNGNKIRYTDAFPGVDVEYEYIDSKLKQSVYLSQKARDNLPDPQTLGLNPNNTDLVLVTQIALPDSLDAFANNAPISTKPQGKIRLAFEGEDGVEFRNNGGKLKFFLPSDFAFAASGVDSAGAEASSRKMWRRFFSTGNNNFMATGVPVKWLYKQSKGTVVLDPTVSLTPPTDDVWIESDDPSYNYNSYTQIRIGRGDDYGWKRSLVRFDLSAIPPNASIQSATMQLYFYGKFGANIINRTINCHQVLQSWGEAYATWNYRGPGPQWNTPGLAFDNIDAKDTPEDTQNWYNEYPTWKSYNLTALTQQWVNNPAQNYGVIFWATDEDDYQNGDEKWCYSSEYTGDVTKRPKLVVTFQVDPMVDIAYDALSRPVTLTYANGVTETNQYDDNRGWLKRRDYQKSGSNIYYFKSDVAGDYDQAGNLKKVEYKHKTSATEIMEYVYWEDHTLKEFKHKISGGAYDVVQSYDCDRNGNLTVFPGKTMTYGLSNGKYCNQLTSDGSRTFQYDLAGRIKQINSTVITHDIRNNMTAHGSNTYSYDAFGQRIRKTEGGTSKYYVTSGPQILAEYKSTNELEAEYIYALGRMVAKLDPSRGYKWFYVDHLGSTRMIDDGGTTALRRDYYPYGQAYLASGNDQTAYQFTGKELDSVIGLYYFGARYYDPSIGRWFVPDPAGQGWSPYAYAGNSPLVFVDPDGRFFWIAAGIVIGAYLGGSMANDWQFNPGKWAWDKGKTYFGIVGGGILGGVTAANIMYGLGHGTGVNLNFIAKIGKYAGSLTLSEVGTSAPYISAAALTIGGTKIAYEELIAQRKGNDGYYDYSRYNRVTIGGTEIWSNEGGAWDYSSQPIAKGVNKWPDWAPPGLIKDLLIDAGVVDDGNISPSSIFYDGNKNFEWYLAVLLATTGGIVNNNIPDHPAKRYKQFRTEMQKFMKDRENYIVSWRRPNWNPGRGIFRVYDGYMTLFGLKFYF